MASREVVALDELDLAELERILLDRDADAALEFLKQAIWERIRQARRGRLDPRQPMGPLP